MLSILTTWDRRLYFPPKEIVLTIFIVLQNPPSSAVFEHGNLGFNGKHNQYTTENDIAAYKLRTVSFKHTLGSWV
jgi:hypothetical protein